MDQYVTGAMIKCLRERKGLTQSELASRLAVSDKAVSKWETGKGYPDITLFEPLSKALDVSVIELLSGNTITNGNRSFNMLRTKLYVCPICGNIISAAGEAVISCCGLVLPALEAEQPDDAHALRIEPVEDELYVTVPHDMTKTHFISFIAGIADNGIHLIKLYPEGNAETRFKAGLVHSFFYYCNRHGLFRQRL